MSWPNLGQWEWAIGEAIVLPLLFFELYRLRRSQRRDREAARDSARSDEPREIAGEDREPPPHP